MHFTKIKKLNPLEEIVDIEFTTDIHEGRSGGTTIKIISLPKVLADLVDEK
jgi:hypothetical protein